jgi:hypothetical protein
MANNQPPCYGKLWDPNLADCRGGLDPSYTHPKTGSNRREMCKWYQPCGAAATHSKLHEAAKVAPPPPPRVAPPPPVQAPGQVIPPTALVKAPPAPPPVGVPPQASVPMQVVHGAPPQHVAHVGAVAYTQPVYAAQPAMVPMNQPLPGAATQSFLMVPEPEDPSVPWGVRMWRNTYRAMGKAGLMTMANFLDYNTIGPRRTQ